MAVEGKWEMHCTSGKKLNNEIKLLNFGLTLERVGGTNFEDMCFGSSVK
jgi:hypothetical protein